MTLPCSKSQIERLGKRLITPEGPAEDDLSLLNELLIAYDEILASAMDDVRGLGFNPTGRIKNTGTILEKLHRHGGSWLKSIQDLAGMRVVLATGRVEQDAVTALIMDLFAKSCPREPKLIDRRKDPSAGYRAVHVVIYPEGVAVEVQVRTRWQHEWADVFEKLADLVGRGIRYGEPPIEWWDVIMARHGHEPPGKLASLRDLHNAAFAVHAAMVKSALAMAELIEALEQEEAAGTDPEHPEMRKLWQYVQNDLADFRTRMGDMTPVPTMEQLGTVEA
ncbi:hypothetical protein E6P78_30985 [Streptomyces sp. A0958]|uniref:hypothetical protein n=1 Tax=Streptomyces sp. A0958 TaxID=2563101 RepID=UPI00109ECB87|nr:hypothetical protein [Streptomyces sp. A0958]THA57757.1 hypothetical protein E6P78_30985 [Streptomyces sp. A0958]